MGVITEVSNFDPTIDQIEVGDAVIGGPGGIANLPTQNLANRTRYLKDRASGISKAYNSITGIGNASGSGSITNVFNFPIPANFLSVNGDEIEIQITAKYTNNDVFYFKLKENSTYINTLTVSNVVDSLININYKISRIDSANQVINVKFSQVEDNSTPSVNAYESTTLGYLTMDLTILNTIYLDILSTAPGANMLVLHKATVYSNKVL